MHHSHLEESLQGGDARPPSQSFWFCRSGMGPRICLYNSSQRMLKLNVSGPHFEICCSYPVYASEWEFQYVSLCSGSSSRGAVILVGVGLTRAEPGCREACRCRCCKKAAGCLWKRHRGSGSTPGHESMKQRGKEKNWCVPDSWMLFPLEVLQNETLRGLQCSIGVAKLLHLSLTFNTWICTLCSIDYILKLHALLA